MTNGTIKSITGLVLFSALLFLGCGGAENSAMGESLEEKKSLLAEKKTELKSLSAEIKMLENEIAELEPEQVGRKSMVILDTLQAMDMVRFATLQASVRADEMVHASSDIGGRLVSVRVKEGDRVVKGQLIASVDSEVYRKQKEELETSLALAVTVYEKQKNLWDQNIGSEVQYLQAKNNKERLEKSLETIKTQLAKANIHAPITGIVDMEHLKSGEVAGPGMPVVTILNTNKIKVVADVPENYLTTVKKGSEVTIYFPALDLEVQKKISMVGRSIDPTNRTFKVEVEMDSRGGSLKPNLLAEMKMKDLFIPKTLAIPLELIQEEVSGTKFVFVAGKQDSSLVAVKKYVETGEVADNLIQVTKGLEVGDIFIVQGARTVTEGDVLINE